MVATAAACCCCWSLLLPAQVGPIKISAYLGCTLSCVTCSLCFPARAVKLLPACDSSGFLMLLLLLPWPEAPPALMLQLLLQPACSTQQRSLSIL